MAVSSVAINEFTPLYGAVSYHRMLHHPVWWLRASGSTSESLDFQWNFYDAADTFSFLYHSPVGHSSLTGQERSSQKLPSSTKIVEEILAFLSPNSAIICYFILQCLSSYLHIATEIGLPGEGWLIKQWLTYRQLLTWSWVHVRKKIKKC